MLIIRTFNTTTMKTPKQTPTDPEFLKKKTKTTKIETELPLSEKDEVKNAENKLQKNQKKQGQ